MLHPLFDFLKSKLVQESCIYFSSGALLSDVSLFIYAWYVFSWNAQGTCKTCPAGTIDDDRNASTPCLVCPRGTYSFEASTSLCEVCLFFR